MAALSEIQKHLRYQARVAPDAEKQADIKAEISGLTTQIGGMRKEVRLCEDIEKRSAGLMADYFLSPVKAVIP